MLVYFAILMEESRITHPPPVQGTILTGLILDVFDNYRRQLTVINAAKLLLGAGTCTGDFLSEYVITMIRMHPLLVRGGGGASCLLE